MKNLLKSNHLPLVTAGLGGILLVLRRLLYAVAVDGKNLLVANHPLELFLTAVTVLALVFILAAVRKLGGSNAYADNFRESKASAAGHVLAALGFLATVLTKEPLMGGYLGQGWKTLGLAAPVCLLLAGYARLKGKQPFFLLHLVPCLFLVLHIVNHYQVWSGNPQLQDYIFTFLGTMALMFFSFYTAAFSVGSGNRRMQLGMGLAAVLLCMGELAASRNPLLYLGGIVWVLTGLCSLTPTAGQAEPEEK